MHPYARGIGHGPQEHVHVQAAHIMYVMFRVSHGGLMAGDDACLARRSLLFVDALARAPAVPCRSLRAAP